MWNEADTQQALEVDFSISFGDVIFGLLFFFFILALALIFQKPQVKEFHRAIDLISNRYETSKESIKLLEHRLETMKKELLDAQAKIKLLETQKDERMKKMEDLLEENDELKKSLNQMSGIRIKSWEESNLVEKKYYQQLLNEKQNLEREYDETRERYLDEIDRLEEKQKEEAESMYRSYLKILDEYQTKLQKFEDYQSITEKVLKEKGMENILAEIADMAKKDQLDKEGKLEKEMVEKSDIPWFQLYIKQYGSDDFNLELRVDGQTEISYDGVNENAILGVINDIMERFGQASKDKSDQERAKMQPVAYVMVHPGVPYGVFNSFMVKSRRIIGKMSVVDWGKK